MNMCKIYDSKFAFSIPVLSNRSHISPCKFPHWGGAKSGYYASSWYMCLCKGSSVSVNS